MATLALREAAKIFPQIGFEASVHLYKVFPFRGTAVEDMFRI